MPETNSCPKCGTMLNDSGTEAATILHTPHYYHNTKRCRDVLHAKLEEAVEVIKEIAATSRARTSHVSDIERIARAALERLRSHGK